MPKSAAPKKSSASSIKKKAAPRKKAQKELLEPSINVPRVYNNVVIITDFNSATENAQVDMCFRSVFMYAIGAVDESRHLPEDLPLAAWRYFNKPELPPYSISIDDVPLGHIDSAAFNLYESYRALGRSSRPNIFIHVTDPNITDLDNRSILVTDEDNVFLGPNNGSLGMMAAYFHSRDIPFELFRIDRKKVEQLERVRLQQKTYTLSTAFHGRDLLAVCAGMIAGGIAPGTFAVKEASVYPLRVNEFAGDITTLPLKKGDAMPFWGFVDVGNRTLRTNITLSPEILEALSLDGAEYRIYRKGVWPFPWVRAKASHVPAAKINRKPVLHLSPTYSPNWDERFVEISLSKSCLMTYEKHAAEPLMIKRVK